MARLGFLALIFAVSCGGATVAQSSDGGAMHDAGVTGACNELSNDAPLLALRYVPEAPPASQGGTIANGTYRMTEAAIYTGPGGMSGDSGETSQVTIQVVGDTVQVATRSSPSHTSVALTPSGSSLTWKNTCPDDASATGQFSATPTSIVVVLPAGTQTSGRPKFLVESFRKD